MHASGRRAGYGIDRPGRVVAATVLSTLFALVTVFAGSATGLVGALGPLLACLVALAWLSAQVWASQVGKRRAWVAVLDELDLRGDERALDLGCGRGLPLVEVARRLPDGHVTGVDVWRPTDLSGNQPVVAQSNADLEGVGERVDVRHADLAQRLPFDDATFDLVTAGLVLRALPDDAARATVAAEAVRVLRPGGRIVVVDSAHTEAWAEAIAAAGLAVERRPGRQPASIPPARVVTATRPGPSA